MHTFRAGNVGTGWNIIPWSLALVICVTALAIGSPGVTEIAAAEFGQTITIGESNDDTQRAELLDFFGVGDDDTVVTVTVDDTQQAMDGIFDLSGVDSAYSSTALACRDRGAGLAVTTRNIQQIPPDLYAMALVTAGIGDAALIVAAPDDAPALGMTALTGVFKAWDLAACESAATSSERQNLALEELALAATIGQSLDGENGVRQATSVVIETQEIILANGITDDTDIAQALSDQEDAAGIAIPDEQRDELLAFFDRLVAADLDWGSYASGWTIKRNDEDTDITMIGNGEQSDAARADAPAGVGGGAPAKSARQSTAAPTAAPTGAPTPLPTASTAAVVVDGEVAARGPDRVEVVADDVPNVTVAYPLTDGARVFRAGAPSSLGAIEAGDSVRLTVDPATGRATEVRAEPAPAAPSDGGGSWLRNLGWLAPIALVALAALLYARRRAGKSFWLTRPAAQPISRPGLWRRIVVSARTRRVSSAP